MKEKAMSNESRWLNESRWSNESRRSNESRSVQRVQTSPEGAIIEGGND